VAGRSVEHEEDLMIIDSHSHLFPPAWASSGRLPADMFDVDVVLARQEEGGVDLTVISDPHIWYGDRDLGDIANARAYNDYVAGLVAEHPGRIAALGTTTPWRGAEHVAEAARAVRELGLSGLAIPTSDDGRYLDTVPAEFWELVEELDVPVFIHPSGTVVGQDLMDSYRLGEVCGRPLDTTLTLARFILTGVAERFPAVRLLCSHAGGAITMIADRLDFGHELRDYAPLGPWGPVHLSEPPSHYVRRLYLDTVTFGPGPLRLALETVGPDQVCFGTDGPPVPFAMSRMRQVVTGLGLEPDVEAAVLGGNAQRLFGLGS
jgi:aminocarboxymuconate-semialdehyde decarboxylase